MRHTALKKIWALLLIVAILLGGTGMTLKPRLVITDGTSTINLLNIKAGYETEGWRQRIAQYKGGGTWQNSPLSEGRRLVAKEFSSVQETLPLFVSGKLDDATIRALQDLLRLLEKASDYWATHWQDEPVWVEKRAAYETEISYATVYAGSVPEVDDIFSPNFIEHASMVDLALELERQHFMDDEPTGAGSEVVATSTQNWEFDEKWYTYTGFGAVPQLPATTYTAVETVGNDTIILGSASGFGGNDNIYYSNDGGSTWATAAGNTNDVIDFLKLSDDYILGSVDDLAGTNRIILSTDQGQNWSILSTGVGGFKLIRLANGDIITADAYESNLVEVSDDGGATWSSIYNFTSGGITRQIKGMALSPVTGTLIAITEESVSGKTEAWRSTDSGSSWTAVALISTSAGSANVNPVTCNSDGIFFISNPEKRSFDDGQNFNALALGLLGEWLAFSASNGNVYKVGGGAFFAPVVYESIDGAVSFDAVHTIGAGAIVVYDMAESDDGNLYVAISSLAGAGSLVYTADEDDYLTTCGGASSDRMYIANKRNVAQLTHIYIDDGGVFSANHFPVSAAFDLLPVTPAVNDAVYFGIDTSVDDSGPFSSLVFNLAITKINTDIVWEYWSGAAWSTLTTTDNTSGFANPGINSVHWNQPSDWATTAVNGVTGYWVRARVIAVSSPAPPTQDDYNVYTVVAPYIDVASSSVGGDIPALLRMLATNQSDKDGPGGSGPNLYSSRLLVGLRSTDRGSRFSAYLNAADEQNPDGVTVSAGTNSSFQNNVETATGRMIRYNPGGAESMASRATWVLDTDTSRHYYGEFRAFLRGRQSNGSAGDILVRLKVTTGSGGVSWTGRRKPFANTNDDQIIDLGVVTLPVASAFKQSDVADEVSLSVQASSDSGTPDLYVYDLVLLPVDEWAVDIQDTVNTSDSAIDNSEYAEIDSASYPKRRIRSIVRDADGLIKANWLTIANDKAILQSNASQRLWFLATRFASAGSSDVRSDPEIVHSAELYSKQRYLGPRGDR